MFITSLLAIAALVTLGIMARHALIIASRNFAWGTRTDSNEWRRKVDEKYPNVRRTQNPKLIAESQFYYSTLMNESIASARRKAIWYVIVTAPLLIGIVDLLVDRLGISFPWLQALKQETIRVAPLGAAGVASFLCITLAIRCGTQLSALRRALSNGSLQEELALLHSTTGFNSTFSPQTTDESVLRANARIVYAQSRNRLIVHLALYVICAAIGLGIVYYLWNLAK